MSMGGMVLQDIENHVLRGISMKIPEGSLFVLLGPSGAGKTTLLNIIAGLMPYRGKIFFNGSCIDSLPSYLRRVGYLFQDLLLFPHLTIKKNLTIAMKHQGLNRKEKYEKADDLLRLFQIAHIAEKFPGEVSGGEKQRAALARAVSTAPDILLLDEPFSNLDYRTARYLRLELKRIQRQLHITTLFVTHNLDEAQELGDQIGVLQDGLLIQRGRPGEIFLSPFEGSDRFLQRPNILKCSERKRLGNGLMEMTWAGRSIFVPDEGKPFDRVAIHPQHVYISRVPPPGPAINRFQAHIKAIREQKGYARILLHVDQESLEAEMSSEDLATLNLRVGDPVFGILKLRALHGC